MTNLENVIKGLECCMSERICKGCPYKEKDECEDGGYYYSKAIEDALELLREQEPVKPNKSPLSMDDGFMWVIYECGFCGSRLRGPANYCDRCGKKVKWDD